jgi:hypothetical protein
LELCAKAGDVTTSIANTGARRRYARVMSSSPI